jgi:hypothetical protein
MFKVDRKYTSKSLGCNVVGLVLLSLIAVPLHAQLQLRFSLTDLGALGGYSYSEARGLNNKGDVVDFLFHRPEPLLAFFTVEEQSDRSQIPNWIAKPMASMTTGRSAVGCAMPAESASSAN